MSLLGADKVMNPVSDLHALPDPSDKGTIDQPSQATRPEAHRESHVGHGALIRNCVIGFSDGLTVPFALTAGLSSLGDRKLVVLAGLAELFSGAISMGLGAFLAAITDRKHYDIERARETREVRDCPAAEEEEIYEIFDHYGISRHESKGVVNGLKMNEHMWVQFMMDFELKLEKPATMDAWVEAVVMGFSYFIGGLLPMIPYFALENVTHALFTSIGITACVLVVFGFVKAIGTGTTHRDAVVSAAHTLLIGAAAAGASYGIVKAVDTSHQF